MGRDGLLPPGRHVATLNEIWDVFVAGAPFKDEREPIFDALQLTITGLVSAGGPSTLWVDGGFVTHKTWAAPHDVDLVYLCRDEAHMLQVLEHPRALTLLTLMDVAIWRPISTTTDRLQPMGGLVDAFLARPARFWYWDALWSSVKGEDGNVVDGAVKGYVEVIV